jgi:hypothetical protein
LDLAGVLLLLRETKVQVASAVLAVRRDDSHAAERHLLTAQGGLTSLELDLELQDRGSRA